MYEQEEPVMTTNTRRSHVYVGLAGETAPGRVIKSGLYRMRDDDGEWKLVTRGLPAARSRDPGHRSEPEDERVHLSHPHILPSTPARSP